MRAQGNRLRRGVLALLALCLGFGLLGATAWADGTQSTVYYRECSYDADQKKVVSETKSVSDYTVVNKPLTEFANGGWYVVTNTSTTDNYTYNNGIRSIKVADNGTANLILLDGTYWEADGIIVNENSTLNIYAGSRDASSIGEGGELYCRSDGSGCAGIGGGGQDVSGDPYPGNLNHNCGTVNIHGGTITASGNGAAGIGSSKFDNDHRPTTGNVKNGGSINIYGGTVNANGSDLSAGIGGGRGANGGVVKIYGGVVNAESKPSRDPSYGAGIGGGDENKNGYGGEVYIYGGSVTASGGTATWIREGEVVPNSGGLGIGVAYDTASQCDLDRVPAPNGILRVYNNLKVFGKANKEDNWTELTDGTASTDNGKDYATRCKYMQIHSDDVEYRAWDTTINDWKDEKVLQGNYTDVTDTTTTWNAGWYVVRGSNTDLSGKTVNVSGTVNLILVDGFSVPIGQLNIANGATLNVYGQTVSSGALTTGTIQANNTGKLVLHGGQVTATATGENTSAVQCNDVTVYGGKLTGTGTGTGLGINGTKLTVRSGIVVRGGASDSADALRYVTGQNGTYVRFPYMVVTVETAPTHAPSDKHSGLSFTIWDLEDQLPTAPGNYFLNRDVTLSTTWNVPTTGEVNLCLNGNGIKMASGSNQRVIKVPNGATLNVYDCGTTQHQYTTPKGMPTVVRDDYNYTGTNPNEISTHFTGGYITGGRADVGAGVYIDASGTFQMSGGTILGNQAGEKGGGVYVDGTFQMSGSPVIKGNKSGEYNLAYDDLTSDNVYLAASKVIKIVQRLSCSEPIGVTAEALGFITSGWSSWMNNAEPGDYFQYDTTANEIYKDGLDLRLKGSEATLTHDGVTKHYARLSKALAAAQNDDTVTLLSDVETAETLVTTQGTGQDEHLTLDLDGYGIKMTGTGSVLRVEDGILDLKDSNPTRTGGANRPEGVKGGYLTGGNAEYGGGLCVAGVDNVKDGLCIMYAGTITGNTASEGGGGVYVRGTFQLKGGTITGNTASGNGGGVYADDDTFQFSVSGGSITGNTASGNGGGVYFKSGNFWLRGGDCTITGNTAGTEGITNNVYLCSGQTMNIHDTALELGTDIGVTMERPGVFTTDWHNRMPGKTPTDYFSSDREEYLPMIQKVGAADQVALVSAEAVVTTSAGVSTSYFVLAEAAQNWPNDSTLKLLEDVVSSDGLSVTGNKAVTLNLNGHALRYMGDSPSAVIQVGSGSTLTVQGGDTAKKHYVTLTDGRGTHVSDTSSEDAQEISGGCLTGGTAGGIANEGTLSVSGVTVLGNTTSGSGGGVNTSGSFTMENSTITSNTAGDDGGGVYVSLNGSFTMKSGAITDNSAGASGGGVNAIGSFTMESGAISNNTAAVNGGGVNNVSSFTMESGAISNNTADVNGGGVYVGSTTGSFAMQEGVSITGNTTDGSGGGVYISGGGVFELTGGTISGNRAETSGGGMYDFMGDFKVSGAPVLKDNTLGRAPSDVALLDSSITLTGALTFTDKIGVTRMSTENSVISDAAGPFTSGWKTHMDTQTPTDFFASDLAKYSLRRAGDELELFHTPASGPVDVAVTPDSLTLTYGYTSGNELTVSADNPDDADYKPLAYRWYECDSDGNETADTGVTTGTFSLPLHRDVGSYYYRCEITAQRADNDETATETTAVLPVTVNRAESTAAAVTANDRTKDGTEKPLVKVDDSTLEGGEMRYALGKDGDTPPEDGWSAAVPKGTDAGTYYVWYYVEEDANHIGTEKKVVTVTITTPDAPTKGPEIVSTTSQTIVVRAAAGLEYSADGKTWFPAKKGEETVTITGLEAGREYDVIARVARTDAAVESASSPATRASTKKTQEAPTTKPEVRKTTAESFTISTEEGVEYSIDGGETWQKKGTFKDLKPDTKYTLLARRAATDDAEPSPAVKVAKITTAKDKTSDVSYDSLSDKEKKKADELAEVYGVDKDTAARLLKAADKLDVSMDTLKLTGDNLKKMNVDSDDPDGTEFGRLRARITVRGKKKMTLKWIRQKKADGYLIYGNQCDKKHKLKLYKTIKKNETVSCTQKKLKKGAYYKFIVVAYQNVKSSDGKKTIKMPIAASVVLHAPTRGGKTTVGKSVTVRVKKEAVTKISVKKGKSVTLKATENKDKKQFKLKAHRAILFESSNPSVATVNDKGKVTGKKKGKCTVWAYAQNGVFKAIKVTVK